MINTRLLLNEGLRELYMNMDYSQCPKALSKHIIENTDFNVLSQVQII